MCGPTWTQATVFAATLRFGAGIQNKVLEAMAMEVPVVATPSAADGCAPEDGEQPPLQVASDAPQLAALICKRLAEHASDPSPVAEARRFVERHYVWRSSGQKLDQVFNRVVDVVKH